MQYNLDQWMREHRSDYLAVMNRVEKTRTLLLSGTESRAASILKKAYVFSVLSIRTGLDRHERAFKKWALNPSDRTLKEASKSTVYGNQKFNWMKQSFDENGWRELAVSVRHHASEGNYERLLEVIVDNFKGVSHRKGAFLLAMAGLYEYLCIDSNVAEFMGYEESTDNSLSFTDATEYMETCEEVLAAIPNELNLPPFLLQWACYDYQRGEHATHLTYYREVLPEIVHERKK